MGVSRGEIGMSQVKSLVTIKGTKDGLIFLLDDRCSFDQLIEDLREKLSSDYYKSEKNDPIVYVQIDLGNRLLTKSDQETIESIITSNSHLRVHHYHSNVVTVEKAKAMQEEVQTATLTRMIRSGQIVKMKGNVLLIGDVNPGGCLMATGNIYIMGALKGKAHAGYNGDTSAFICASHMSPTSLHIHEHMLHFADKTIEDAEMQAVFIDSTSGEMTLTKVQRLFDVESRGLKEAEAVS